MHFEEQEIILESSNETSYIEDSSDSEEEPKISNQQKAQEKIQENLIQVFNIFILLDKIFQMIRRQGKYLPSL